MDPESSFELIERLQAGDSSALERLVERYRPRMHRWASGRLPRSARDMTDADVLVQEALIATITSLSEFEHRTEWALQAHLRSAVMNHVRDELRRFDSRPPRTNVPDDAPTPELSPLEATVGPETFARYEAALAELGETEREGVIARLELGCTYQEIAVLLDTPTADAARMSIARALTTVAELMSRPIKT